MIHLNKNGKIIYEYTEYLGEDGLRGKEIHQKEVLSIIPYLNEIVELEENFNLEDFFEIIKRDFYQFYILLNYNTLEHVFKSFGSDRTISSMIEELSKEDDEKEIPGQKLEHFEIYRFVEFWNYIDEKDLEMGVGCTVKGKLFDEHRKEWFEENFCVEGTPLNQLKKYPIKLCKEVEVWNWNAKGRVSNDLDEVLDKINNFENKEPPAKIIFTGNTQFTVYEFFGAVLAELK